VDLDKDAVGSDRRPDGTGSCPAHVRYTIVKSMINPRRYIEECRYRRSVSNGALAATYFGSRERAGAREPFAMLHRQNVRGEL
jgi:hypothetical protein